MLKISGSRAHAGTGKVVPYLAEIVLVGSTEIGRASCRERV